MRAVRFHEYGDASALTLDDDVEAPHAGPGQVRIAVRAAGVNPMDWKFRAGYMREFMPVELPTTPGGEAAGVVDEIGVGVEGVTIGDELFGLTGISNGYAEHAVLFTWAPKPAAWSWAQAAGAGIAVETATRALDELGVADGNTLLINGAAGGVGTAAVQIARARGIHVIGTAGEGNHQLLRDLGALPVAYGEGLPERVAAIAPNGVDFVLDAVGKGSLQEFVSLVGLPAKVITIAHPDASELGVPYSAGAEPTGAYGLAVVAELANDKAYTVPVQATYTFEQAAEAHRISEAGHLGGKLVLTTD